MGINKWVQDQIAARNARLANPTLRASIDNSRDKAVNAWKKAGSQTLDSTTQAIWNTTARPFTGKKTIEDAVTGKKSTKPDPVGHMHQGAVDSTIAVGKVVGRILVASGRTAWWGIRHTIAK
ncbi:hypothetical protein A2763_02215 [Candidatus Kaiserbacteria bacterium RIFCSPHIGHO2_01_FULL_54_36]|uniref:Uncharacterized protein n=1 Tax=Candidatus Kaiserbacteria bacterium RIFCSPHIGHO2_01_FULL_54_36 TaxID=1798482 RepID=A0A1F6CQI8_9BACT|nr:MAG: hypothetical protein A2763_02215 [Candidatus Kaiserbacteria bacterium RIFCSPHIGHO2_01_FULL_54_36]OGG75921.1 MAG: hypothetical protein A3A41_04685 [Candidatus Kaiserbacteria bacterium RIFCSPLOWO2_01_FULL_54_22]